MRFETTASDLKKVLIMAARVAESSTIPVLAYVRVGADKTTGSLKVSACDLDMTLTLTLPSVAHSRGALLIPLRPMLTLLKHIAPRTHVIIEDDGKALTARFDSARYPMARLPTGDFPAGLEIVPDGSITPEEPAALADALRQVAPAMSTEETRYYLNGVYLDIQDGLRLVATDGHRLFVRRIAARLDGLTDDQMIVPHKAIQALAQLGAVTAIETMTEPHCLRFFTTAGTLTTKLIDAGKRGYPDWRRVVPENGTVGFEIDIPAILPVLRRIQAMAMADCDYKTKGVCLTAGDGASLTSAAPNYTFAREDLPPETLAPVGAPLAQKTFNAAYLIEILRLALTTGPSTRLLGGAGYGDPVMIEAQDLTAVIMPMRPDDGLMAAGAVDPRRDAA